MYVYIYILCVDVTPLLQHPEEQSSGARPKHAATTRTRLERRVAAAPQRPRQLPRRAQLQRDGLRSDFLATWHTKKRRHLDPQLTINMGSCPKLIIMIITNNHNNNDKNNGWLEDPGTQKLATKCEPNQILDKLCHSHVRWCRTLTCSIQPMALHPPGRKALRIVMIGFEGSEKLAGITGICPQMA